MDKRFKPLSPIEQLQKRKNILVILEQHPHWEISKVAKFIRNELHLTLKEMSKFTQISPQTLQKLEQPQSNPTLETMLKLLNTFGLQLTISVKDDTDH